MKTFKRDEYVRSSVEEADKSIGDAPKGTLVWFYLAKALIAALCAIADAIENLEIPQQH